MGSSSVHMGGGLKVFLKAALLVAIPTLPMCAAMWWFYAEPKDAFARAVFPALLTLYLVGGTLASIWLMPRMQEARPETHAPSAPSAINRPMRAWKTIATYFLVGVALWAIGLLPVALGVPRAWVVAVISYLAFVGPLATLTFGVAAVASEEARITGWGGLLGLFALGTLLNGLTWAVAALAFEWARHRARVLFAVLVGLLVSYGALALMVCVGTVPR